MTAARDPIEPTHDVPLSVAVEEITGFETMDIEKRFGCKLEELGGTRLLMGIVWVYENRGDSKRSWAAVQGMTLRELNGYFPPEPKDVDATDPDSDLGKGSTADAAQTHS